VQARRASARIGFAKEMRRKFFFEPAEPNADDQPAPHSAQGEIEHRRLRVRILARDIRNKGDPRTRHGLPAFDALGERIENLGRAQTAQMQRHAHEALAIANILASLVDVELRDHQREIVGRPDRVGRLAVDVDEVWEIAELEVPAPLLERSDRQVDRIAARDGIRSLRSRRALQMHVDFRFRHRREPPRKLRPLGGGWFALLNHLRLRH
jgi:hypothetical protein